MTKRYFIIFITALIFFTSSLSAEPDQPVGLDIEKCIELALENNPDFVIAGIDLQTAERKNKNTWNNFLPGISAGGSLNGSSPLLTETPDFSWSAAGSVNLSLSLSAGIVQTIESVRLDYESEKISYEQAERQLISAVEKEFYYLITSKSSLEILKANLELAVKNYEQTLSNYNHGMSSDLSVLQAEVKAANLEPAYKQSLSAHNARKRSFLIILGMDPEAEIRFEGELDTKIVNFETQLLTSNLSERLDLQALEKSLEILENSRKLTAANYKTPTLSVSSGWTVTALPSFSDSLSLGLSLSVPIDDFIPGSSTALSIKSLEDQILQLEISIENAEETARTEIINLVEQLETAADNMKSSALNIKLAEKSYEMSEESYTRGAINRLDVEDTQQELLSAKHQYLSSQYNYLTGLISLRDALALKTIEELYSKGVIK